VTQPVRTGSAVADNNYCVEKLCNVKLQTNIPLLLYLCR